MAKKQVLSAVGSSAPVPIIGRIADSMPSILCLVSPGAVMTYSIEVAVDDTGTLSDSSVTWFPFDAAAVGLTGSQNAAITSRILGVRVTITSWTSGSLTFQVAQ